MLLYYAIGLAHGSTFIPGLCQHCVRNVRPLALFLRSVSFASLRFGVFGSPGHLASRLELLTPSGPINRRFHNLTLWRRAENEVLAAGAAFAFLFGYVRILHCAVTEFVRHYCAISSSSISCSGSSSAPMT